SESLAQFGFLPVRLTVDNGEARELKWRGSLSLSSYVMGTSHVVQTNVVLTVPAGRGVERWFFVPSVDDGVPRGRGYGGWAYGVLNVNLSGDGIPSTALRLTSPGGG